ncbi:DUF2911 domain-containing protein [Rubrivirga sp. S365]|uniref:DUF2911 domain-containing protein n=1 Tax=Rubrivirga sp. S365 TaxID=3076080 RepID=UPI0028C7E57D|nr:DUF2911 domain-containing protein [Rubrivirga sp. S365]MDT7858399.1 DUF2911 domain-containing protein [Rubrivirga sp. S365]
MFVARLGADTVAVERVVRDARGLDVTLVTRVPTTQRTEARLDLDADGRMLAFTSETRGAGGEAVRAVRMTRDGDSLRVGDGTSTRALAAGPDALPFVEYAHAPFDLALRRGTDGTLPMATGRSVLDFTVTRDGRTATVRHPFRGPMAVTLGPDGGLATLDAAETTRKLVVTRAPGFDVDAFQRRAAALDAAGRGIGPLSGRAEAQSAVAGAEITVDHGQPSLRGRQVWGTVVPYGRVWRTGADRATHLTTSRPLVFGRGADAVRVPAGTVTLFSVPEADGGVLVVNGQTGQNGNAYDPARDLGRVPFELDALAEPVERLEIVAEPDGDGGRLVVRWGDQTRSVPFRVE